MPSIDVSGLTGCTDGFILGAAGFTSSNGTLPQGTSADGTGGAVSGGFNSWLSLSSALLVVALSFSVL